MLNFGMRKLVDNYMKVWTADSEGLLDIYADEDLVVEYTHLNKIEGKEAFKGFLRHFYQSFPDVDVQLLEVVPNKKDNSITVFWNYTGTHQNIPLFGVQPQGKKITVNAISLLRIKNGKVVHEKGIIDNLSLLMQLNPQK